MFWCKVRGAVKNCWHIDSHPSWAFTGDADGDRDAVVSALAQVILCPHYRTCAGVAGGGAGKGWWKWR